MYSFGVVLLEIITGRKSMDKTRPSGQENLVEWARPFLRDKKNTAFLVDHRLNGMYLERAVRKAASLAERCLSRDPRARPAMQEIVDILGPLQTYKDVPSSSGYMFSAAPPRDAKSRASPTLMNARGYAWN